MTSERAYENCKLCDELKPAELCFVLEQYNEGKFDRIWHRHVPKIRLSKDGAIDTLRTLVARYHGFSGMSADQIVSCNLNGRGKDPAASNSLRIAVSYPEPGVLRSYCGSNTVAWVDQVIAPDKFRSTAES